MRCATLVIGVGSSWAERDGLGMEVADGLRLLDLPGVEVKSCRGDWFGMLDDWVARRQVFIVDAIVSDRLEEGSIVDYDLLQSDIEFLQKPTTSHGFNIGQVVKMARELKRLPSHLHLLGLALPPQSKERRESRKWLHQKKSLVKYLENKIRTTI